MHFNERYEFEKVKSSASCKFENIQGFVYGPTVSRFWVSRKHINSMAASELKDGLSFFSWQCLTIQLDEFK